MNYFIYGMIAIFDVDHMFLLDTDISFSHRENILFYNIVVEKYLYLVLTYLDVYFLTYIIKINPTMKSIIRLNIPSLELADKYVTNPTNNGPISAANFPSMLYTPKNSLSRDSGIMFAKYERLRA